MLLHTCNPTYLGDEGGSWIEGHPGLYNKALMKIRGGEEKTREERTRIEEKKLERKGNRKIMPKVVIN